MKIRLMTISARPGASRKDGGSTSQPGQVVDRPKEEAERLIASGQAVAAEAHVEQEASPERPTRRRGGRKAETAEAEGAAEKR